MEVAESTKRPVWESLELERRKVLGNHFDVRPEVGDVGVGAAGGLGDLREMRLESELLVLLMSDEIILRRDGMHLPAEHDALGTAGVLGDHRKEHPEVGVVGVEVAGARQEA